jgi:HSP20 family molecular chaperone IbpA
MPPKKEKSTTPAAETSSEWLPFVHAYKTDTMEWLHIHLPKVQSTDVQARIRGRTLLLEGRRRIPTQHELVPFSLSLDLPPTYSVESPEAHYKDDVLTIKFLKAIAVQRTVF